MGQPIMMPSFASGELSPSLFARVDLAKWHSGAALLENFFVDYRGGVSNRPGTRFIGESLDPTRPSRLVPFIFSTVQTYVLVFDHLTMRVIKDGGFVLDGDGNEYTIATPYDASDLALLKFTQSADVMTLVHPDYETKQLTRTGHDAWTLATISFLPSIEAPTGVTATPATGGGTTDYTYVVTAVAENGVTESLPSDLAVSASSKTMSATAGENQTVVWNAVAGAQLYNVYRQAEVDGGSPAPGQIFGFVGTATGTEFVDANIAPDFSRTPPQEFVPFASTTASGIEYLTATLNQGVPSRVSGTGYTSRPTLSFAGGSGSGAVGHVYMAVDNGFTTSPTPGTGYTVGDLLTAVGGSAVEPLVVKVGFVDPVTGGVIFWYVPNSFGYVADQEKYTELPPNPVSFTGGTGAGFTLNIAWGVWDPFLTNDGSGYEEAPTVSVVGGGGSGAAIAATIGTPVEVETYPGCASYFQQRLTFAATNDKPSTFWMSKTGDYLNFSYSTPSRPDDSIVGTIASQQVNAIKHLVPLQSLIALTSGGAWRIDAGVSGGPITPATIEATPQVFNGCSDVPPLVIGRELLYIQSKGSIVRDLQFNFLENTYSGNDLTVLSNHLFYGHQIVEWAYAEEPFKIIWAVRDDGILLAFTFLKEQDVYAWTHHVTEGKVRNVCVIPEDNEDAVYLTVERYVQGNLHVFVERMASRDMGAIPEGVPNLSSVPQDSDDQTETTTVPADLSRAWFVDCGLQYPLTEPEATLTPAATTATLSVVDADIIAAGSGYDDGQHSVVITDTTGTGAVMYAVASGGVITSVLVTNAGEGYTNPTLEIDSDTGSGGLLSPVLSRDVLMDASANIFEDSWVDRMVRINNGWGTIRVVNNPAQITVNIERPLTDTWPAGAGEWSATAPVSTVSGLDHLEGEYVAILADGNVMPMQAVSGGAVELEEPASAIFVGLPYVARFKSLYLDIPGEVPTSQGKRKKISAVSVRVQDTRGLSVGNKSFAAADLVDIKDRDFQPMGQAILPFTGDQRVVMPPSYDIAGQIYIQQANPLPATILGLIPELTMGDTP